MTLGAGPLVRIIAIFYYQKRSYGAGTGSVCVKMASLQETEGCGREKCLARRRPAVHLAPLHVGLPDWACACLNSGLGGNFDEGARPGHAR